MFVDFYIHKDNKQLGPFSKREVFDQILCGKISEEDYCWTEGLETWVPLKSLELTNPSTWTKQEANYVPSSISKRMRMAHEEAQKKQTKKYSLPVRIISFAMGLIVLFVISLSLFSRYKKQLEKMGLDFSMFEFKKAEWQQREILNLLVYSPGHFIPVTHSTLDAELMAPFKGMKKEIYGCEYKDLRISVSKFNDPDIVWDDTKKEILIDSIYNGAFNEDQSLPPLRRIWNETKKVDGHEILSFRYDTMDFEIVDFNVLFEGDTLYFVIATHKPENQDAHFQKSRTPFDLSKNNGSCPL